MTESCPLTIAIVIPQQAQSLDIAGPLAVFREANRLAEGRALYDVQLIAALPDAAVEVDGMRVLADSSIQSPLPPTDTLLVAGTHAYRQAEPESALSVWLGRHGPSVRRVYGCVFSRGSGPAARQAGDNALATSRRTGGELPRYRCSRG